MTRNQACGQSPNHICGSCRQRLFAWMMAKGSDGYEKAVGDRKRSLFANLYGNVLEIGPGTGPNLLYYPKNIHWIGIEPNPSMHPYLQQAAVKLGLNIEIRTDIAECIKVEDNSMDAVVSTLVLCSVPNLASTLQEVLRILKPGGSFLFIEHVAAPNGTLLRRLQTIIRPIWKVLGDGCNPDRETWLAIENAGFSNVNYQHFEAPFPIVSPHIIGVGTK
ncbi:SAM-dependent methyltransferase [Nostoc sp. T09]|uniref:class I SAM-dependent methyltransferase n=1 Tax=Nostoc sp. T09 TaxID=1932621 RepID=UPI000A3937F3|nr:class I SAM-dependent methyltransferase [Nostoc sp. T09]OUL35206.1 SAM-dependent methyltransferase [Nostoc sp. T09]